MGDIDGAYIKIPFDVKADIIKVTIQERTVQK